MSDIIGFADFYRRHRKSTDAVASWQRHGQTSFTPRDREDLDDWSSADHRVSVCSSEMGCFAMIHQAGNPCASWGLVRQGRVVLLWDCVTLADIGRFSSMVDALAGIPVDASPTPVANIVPFAAQRPRLGATG